MKKNQNTQECRMNNNVNLKLLQPKNPIISPLLSNKQEHKMEKRKIQNQKTKKSNLNQHGKNHTRKKNQKQNGFIFYI